MNLQEKIKSWAEKKYLFVIRREEDFSVISSLSITKLKVGLILVLFFMVCLAFSLILSKSLLASWFDPGYQESENTKKIYALSETVDSLMMEVEAKDRYVANIQRIISGETVEDTTTVGVPEPGYLDSLEKAPQKPDLYVAGEATQSIVEEFESMAPDERSFERISVSSFTDTYFFPPIKGVVTGGFKPIENHFGLDIVSEENEPVKSVADGTVIISHWTLETGYVIGIQHSNELISIYKHNSVLLKSVGEPVSGGEVISVIGNTGEQTTGQHLHFELWYKGNPLNPQEFITFD